MFEEEIRKNAWKHAIEFYAPNRKGKVFLIYEDGTYSLPLERNNISKENLENAIAIVEYQNPFDWKDWNKYCKEHNIETTEDMGDFEDDIRYMKVPEKFKVEWLKTEVE